MEINNHVNFNTNDFQELIEFLNLKNIKYKSVEGFNSLDIYESDPNWLTIYKMLNKNGDAKKYYYSWSVFSKSELKNAERLTVRSKWLCGYPQPEGAFEYRDITYSSKNYCKECGCGLEQVDSFRIKNQHKWKKRHFMMLNWVDDEFFVDETAKTLLEKEGYAGVSFCDVKNKNGKEILSDTFQVVISTLQQEGLVPEEPKIRTTLKCPICGGVKYHPSGVGMLKYRKEVFDNSPDIVKSFEYFGWGHSADRIIIISQKAYNFLIANDLTASLEFAPLELV